MIGCIPEDMPVNLADLGKNCPLIFNGQLDAGVFCPPWFGLRSSSEDLSKAASVRFISDVMGFPFVGLDPAGRMHSLAHSLPNSHPSFGRTWPTGRMPVGLSLFQCIA
jgi:hypothetical protein